MPPGAKLLDRLAHEALITPEQHQRAFLHAQRGDGHCYDAIIEVGGIEELELLKYLANLFRTQFVTSQKLEKASVGRKLIEKVPRKVALQLHVCPILFDEKSGVLSVVAADLFDLDVAKQIQMVSRARDVKVYIARPATIEALVRKHYDNDPFAFDELAARSPAAARQAPQQAESAYGAADYYEEPKADSGLLNVGMMDKGASPSEHPAAPTAQSPRARRARSAIKIEAPAAPPQAMPRRPVSIAMESPVLAKQVDTTSVEALDTIAGRQYLETLNVMVALLEQGRGELRGHSAQVARLCRKLGERIGLNEGQMHGMLLAAYLHDIGKASTYHLTAMNVAQYEGHRVQAQKTHQTPLRMFESVRLPKSTVETLTHMYERYDGRGFPGKLKGQAIPLGSRMIAIVETYCDLTTHPKNPYRKVLDPKEACDALGRYKKQFFDPNLLELFTMVVLGDDLKAKLLADRPTVLVVDPDPEETTVLELRLIEHQYEVAIARNAEDALSRIAKGGVDAVITEVELASTDGFGLFAQIRQSELGKDLPIMFLSRRGDSDSVNKGFELGAADYLVKPASADVVAAKARQVLDRKQGPAKRGVSGSLSEMSLPDVVQILSNGRKSGMLEITSGGKSGRIFFTDGAIWDATFGELQAEEGFYAMLVLADGNFSLDPEGRAQTRKINAATESLLLEGMRRLDEANR